MFKVQGSMSAEIVFGSTLLLHEKSIGDGVVPKFGY